MVHGPLTEYGCEEADIRRLVKREQGTTTAGVSLAVFSYKEREQGGPDQLLKCYYFHQKA
jgi:hypothetical protein